MKSKQAERPASVARPRVRYPFNMELDPDTRAELMAAAKRDGFQELGPWLRCVGKRRAQETLMSGPKAKR